MPSKSEIKKNPKSSKIGVAKNTKLATTKKSTAEVTPAKLKLVVKKVAKTNGKDDLAGAKKKLSTKTVTKPLKSKLVLSKQNAPTIEEITVRAHQMWLDEGCPEGRAQIHWQEAERQLAGL